MFNTEDYNYELPEDLIAQVPATNRDGSRLLYVNRETEGISDHFFPDLPALLRPGDILVVNNTRVIPARLFGHKASGGKVEVLVLEHPVSDAPGSNIRWCLLKSSKRPLKGSSLFFETGVTGQVEDHGKDGLVRIAFQGPRSIDDVLETLGAMPLPPYIKRDEGDSLSSLDRERYQTVFSRNKGAVAAPTAGLHFTPSLIERLRDSGINLVEITLHVGHGTFRPVRTRDIRDHHLGEEHFLVEKETAEAINRCKMNGGRVIAVGTTVVRTLETLAVREGMISPGSGMTDLFITPGHNFKTVDGMVTNFHLPKSSLLFLVSAFAGLALIKSAYAWAVRKKYRFFSYGDAMLIL